MVNATDSNTRESTADQAISRDPTLSQEEAVVVATAFGARVCGTEGDAVYENLGEVLVRTEKNERFLNTRLQELVERVGKLEAVCASLLSRKERLRLPPRRVETRPHQG